jgi:hypothetical protein
MNFGLKQTLSRNSSFPCKLNTCIDRVITICLIVFYYIGYVFYCFGYVLLYVYCIGYVLLYCVVYVLFSSQDSVVGIATSYWLDDRGIGVRVPVGSRIFSSPNRPDGL